MKLTKSTIRSWQRDLEWVAPSGIKEIGERCRRLSKTLFDIGSLTGKVDIYKINLLERVAMDAESMLKNT